MFDVNSLDLIKVGLSFGFTVPPRVNLSIFLNKMWRYQEKWLEAINKWISEINRILWKTIYWIIKVKIDNLVDN